MVNWFIMFTIIRKLLTGKCFTKKILAKQMWLYSLWNRLPKMPKISDKKVACKKNIQICTNCDTLSIHDILFSISARHLMNAWLNESFFFLHDSFQPVFNDYCQGTGDQLKLNFRKRMQEMNTLALQRLDQNKFYW